MSQREEVLAGLALFEHLRPDELGQIARRFAAVTLAPGAALAEAADAPRLVVVVRGEVELTLEERGATLRTRLGPGDRFGTLALVGAPAVGCTMRARTDAELAVIDRAGLDAVLEAYPAVALPLARELAQEVATRGDFLRQLHELHAARLPAAELAAAIAERVRQRHRRGARVARAPVRGLFERLVVERGAEPPFWMLAGFLVALAGARLVVYLILKYKLEEQLFNLRAGSGPNPMHIHHFNYGLVLVGVVGLAALRPLGRRALRALAFAFGAGAGLVFDEFALFWRLDPEYGQELSVIAAAIAIAVLVQLVYFRAFWAAVAARAWRTLWGAR